MDVLSFESDQKDNLYELDKKEAPKKAGEILKMVLANLVFVVLAAGIGVGFYFMMLDRQWQVGWMSTVDFELKPRSNFFFNQRTWAITVWLLPY
jgi:hypothetical protein